MSHTVYRVERPDGRGPYYHKLGPWLRSLCNGDQISHPIPCRDGLADPWTYNLWEDPVYGFHDREQLWDWFNTRDVALDLDAAGFHLAVYRVPDGPYLDEGRHQVAFDQGRSERVETKDLTQAWSRDHAED